MLQESSAGTTGETRRVGPYGLHAPGKGYDVITDEGDASPDTGDASPKLWDAHHEESDASPDAGDASPKPPKLWGYAP